MARQGADVLHAVFHSVDEKTGLKKNFIKVALARHCQPGLGPSLMPKPSTSNVPHEGLLCTCVFMSLSLDLNVIFFLKIID